MPSTINLKRRITSIKNTSQITKAMELVSASKLKRAQDYALRSRDYYDLAHDLITRLSAIEETERQPLFEKRKISKKLYIVITSNSGLAGAYNANVLKELTNRILEDKQKNIKNEVIVIGSKGANFVRNLKDVELVGFYPQYGDNPSTGAILPLLNSIIEKFKDKKVDQVDLIYTSFKSTISQTVSILQLLPAIKMESSSTEKVTKVSNFEPDIETVIEQITTRLVEAEIWQAVLESLASEHAMRMMAMKNASDNAKDLIEDYTLELNTIRQASITQELAEISGGVEALKG